MPQVLRGSGAVDATEDEFHVYADGSTGSDTNSGLSSGAPKETLQAVFDLIPDQVKHNTCIHLSGVFTDDGTLSRHIHTGMSLLIDGSDAVTVVDDNAGSDYTTDSASVSSIGDSVSAAWTVDEHMGYWVEILTGPAAGETRLIQSNTATAIVPCRDWSVSPGTGNDFRIVRPATEVSSAGLTLQSTGPGTMQLQRMYFSGTSTLTFFKCTEARADGLLYNSSAIYGIYSLNCGRTIYGSSLKDPDTFEYINAATDPHLGVSQVHASGRLIEAGGNVFQARKVVAKTVRVGGCKDPFFGYGSRVLYAEIFDSGKQWGSNGDISIQNTADHATTKFGGGAIGMLLKNSHIVFDEGDISDCSSHAIEARASFLEFVGAFAGTGSTGAGVYAHLGTMITITDGTPPTITGGTPGDLSFNGTSEASTWAAIDAGTPAASAPEVSMAKEV